MTPRKLYWAPLCLVLLVLVPTSAGVSARSAEGGAAKTLTVAVGPIEPAALAFYAKDRGYFRKQGLDVKIKVLAVPVQGAAAVISGDAQFAGTTIGSLAVAKTQGAPVKLVAAGALNVAKAPTSALVAARGEQITRAGDLADKLVAIDAPNTPAHIGLLKWLKLNGVSAERVRFVYMPFPLMPGPLRRGTVDAAVLPEPLLTVVTQQGAKRVAPIINAVCPQDCLLTAFMARKDIDPEVAARFRNAVQVAAVWANQRRNHAASGVILAKYTGLDKALIAKTTRTSFATRLRLAPAQPWIDVYAEFGVIPKAFPAAELVK
jgi:NitT/TauT family transport system substrate-binding protein